MSFKSSLFIITTVPSQYEGEASRLSTFDRIGGMKNSEVSAALKAIYETQGGYSLASELAKNWTEAIMATYCAEAFAYAVTGYKRKVLTDDKWFKTHC